MSFRSQEDYHALAILSVFQLDRNLSLQSLSRIIRMHGQCPESCADSKSIDPRDAIYSKLGLASDSVTLVSSLDYSKIPREIYIGLVVEHIKIKKRIDILCSAEILSYSTPRGEELHLPSWTPDWQANEYRVKLFSMLPTKSTALLYNADAETSAERNFSRGTEYDVLTVTGFVFGEVQHEERIGAMSLIEHEEEDTTGDPSHIVIELCRTLAANQVLSESYREVDSIPDQAARALVSVIASYDRSRELDKCYFASDLNRKPIGPSEAEYYELLREGWANIQIPGRSLQYWALRCEIAEVSTLEAKRAGKYNLGQLLHSMDTIMKARSVETGRTGRVYLVPGTVQDHDLICVLSGCAMPMVLRKYQEHCIVVGACYANGIMHGEAMREHLTHSSLEEFDVI